MDEPLKYNESWKDKDTNLAYDSISTQHLEKANGDSTQMTVMSGGRESSLHMGLGSSGRRGTFYCYTVVMVA